MHPYFAGFDSLVPGVTKLRVASSATVVEPRSAVATATASTGFRDGAAFGTYGVQNSCGGCWCCCLDIGIDQTHKAKNTILFAVE